MEIAALFPGALKRVKCLLKWLSFVRVRGAATSSAPGRLLLPSLPRPVLLLQRGVRGA